MRSRKNQKVSGNKWKWTQNSPKPMGHSEDRRKFIAIQASLKKDRNIPNKQPKPTPTGIWGTKTKITQSKYKEGNNQDQSRVKWHRD